MTDSNLHPVMQGVFAPHMREAAKFTLDTSGAVERQKQCFVCRGEGRHKVAEVLNGKSPGPIYSECSECGGSGLIVEPATFSDLDAFTQGYVEALFASARPGYDDAALGGHYVCGFSDLSPEALATILGDCAAIQATFLYEPDSRRVWECRQAGRLANFPPLTPTLGDDGKVHLTTGAA